MVSLELRGGVNSLDTHPPSEVGMGRLKTSEQSHSLPVE